MVQEEDEEWVLSRDKRVELFEAIEMSEKAEAVKAMDAEGGSGSRERRIRAAGRRVMWSMAACFAITGGM